MAYKNLGIGVSQLPQEIALGDQFSGEDKSFESIVIQAGKPVIDWEMNLRNEISSDHGVRLSNSRSLPSCWINAGFLDSPDINNAYSFPTPVPGAENVFLINPQNLIVNGWNLRFQYSDSTSTNIINLPLPPVTNYRVDLVILEVWRALILATPSVANKSPTGLILRHGNVKCPDATPNFIDDLIDPTEAAETSARIQIQYRYRVISPPPLGVDVSTYPDGLDDPSVTANTVSDFAGPGADGNPTAYTYSPASDDPGLWIAGSGTAIDAAAFSTVNNVNVDGFMYAIPICAVFRRNSTAYDKTTNPNGGALIIAGTSDRPDGIFSDQIIDSDIKDLRKGVARDYGEILQKTMQQVFNNSLITEHEILSAAGPAGTSLSVKDDVTSTDGIRRYFSDRSITETIVCKIDVPAPGAPLVIFDLSSIQTPWAPAPINMLLTAPGANIVAVNKVRIVDSTASSDKDGYEATSPTIQSIQFPTVTTAGVVFDVPIVPVGLSLTVYAELVIEYPSGDGLSRNVIDSHDVWAPSAASIAAWVDGTLFTVTSDVTRFSLDSTLWEIDNAHREAFLRLQTTTQIVTLIIPDEGAGLGSHLYLWERLDGNPIILGPPFGIPTTNYTFNTAYTVITLPVAIAAGTSVTVTYTAYRPLPIVGLAPADSYQVFYQSRAIQSVLPPLAGTHTVYLTPRTNPDNIYAIVSGSGSPDDSFPFEAPSAQIPVGLLPSTSYPESRLDNPNPVSIIGFGINTGFIKLDAKLPYMPDANAVTLYRTGIDTVIDSDGRHFWPRSDSGSPAVYSPVVYGHLLTASQRHKVVSPVLMELTSDFGSIGRKGTLVLVVLTNWIEFDDENTIQFGPSPSSSCAAVYRVRGNLINSQRAVI